VLVVAHLLLVPAGANEKWPGQWREVAAFPNSSGGLQVQKQVRNTASFAAPRTTRESSAGSLTTPLTGAALSLPKAENPLSQLTGRSGAGPPHAPAPAQSQCASWAPPAGLPAGSPASHKPTNAPCLKICQQPSACKGLIGASRHGQAGGPTSEALCLQRHGFKVPINNDHSTIPEEAVQNQP